MPDETKKPDAKAAPATEKATPEAAPAPTPRLDETVAGGRFVVNGQTVDANGKPIKE